MALNTIMNAVTRHKKEELENKAQYIFLQNIKGETVVSLKRFDTNTWILNPGAKNEEIVKIVIEGEQCKQEATLNG